MSSPVLFTIFGASGDLAKRKLYPSLFRLYKAGHLAENFAVIGTARRPWTKEFFESTVIESLGNLPDNARQAHEFASHFYYQSHDVNDTEHYIALRDLQRELGQKYKTENNKVFFLSMAPEFFGTIAKHLKSEKIVDGTGFERLIIEKPFGTSLETAQKLNEELSQTFEENQIYRIDHYLGKEMVQNIFAVRFANIIFEHIWNRDFIDNVQISFAESIGIEDRGPSCSTPSGWMRPWAHACPGASPVASVSGPAWPWPWRGSPPSSWPTSPPPRWTSSPGPRSSTCSPSSLSPPGPLGSPTPRRRPPCSSSPTTCRPPPSASRSRSWTTAGSSRAARPRRCSPVPATRSPPPCAGRQAMRPSKAPWRPWRPQRPRTVGRRPRTPHEGAARARPDPLPPRY